MGYKVFLMVQKVSNNSSNTKNTQKNEKASFFIEKQKLPSVFTKSWEQKQKNEDFEPYNIESYKNLSYFDEKFNAVTVSQPKFSEEKNRIGVPTGPLKIHQIKNVDLAKKIGDVSKKYGVDSLLVIEVIRQETGGTFNTNLKSGAGARGLMQLMPLNTNAHGVKNPHNIDENLECGVKMLGNLLKQYNGDVQKALAAYNWGSTNFNRNGQNLKKLPDETKNYVDTIYSNYVLARQKKSFNKLY